MAWRRRAHLGLILLGASSLLFGGRVLAGTPQRPSAMGEAVAVDGFRVTLLRALELTGADLETRDGAAAGGRRLIWLIEPREGQPEMPALGEVKLTIAGKQYNQVTNATSSKPFAPDMVIHDFSKFAVEHPERLGPKKLAPRKGAGVVEVIIRGGAIKADAPSVAEFEIGLFPPGTKPSPDLKPRYVWCRVEVKPGK